MDKGDTTGDQLKQTITLNKIMDFSRFENAGIIWDNVGTKLTAIYNIDLVIFGHFKV